MDEILTAIKNERERQISKFGEQKDSSELEMLSILSEEVGEIAQIVTKRNVRPVSNEDLQNFTTEMLKEELLQTATVCVAWIQKL